MIHKHFDKASWTARGLLPLCLALLLPFMTACSSFEQELIDKNVVPLTIYIQAANPQTRAYIGDVASENGEDAIKTIKVWLFDNGTNVGYSESITLNTVTVSVPQSIVSKGSVDVYVIANPASVELQGLDATTTEAQLTQAIMGGTNFTAATPTTAVPEAGLPMSRIVKGCQINTTGVNPTLPEIKLTRAVSKIRFAFARTEDHTGQVLGIKLTGSAAKSMCAMFLEMWNVTQGKNPNDTDEEIAAYLSAGDMARSGLGRMEEVLGRQRDEAREKAGALTYDQFVQPYADGPMYAEPLAENVYISIIERARDYVYISTPYLIITDEMSHALSLAAKRGVDVRIVTPGIPDKKTVFSVTRSYYHGIARNGVRIFEYTPGFCHAKLFLSDDCIATCGTINLDFRGLYLHFENGCFMYKGKVIDAIKADFTRILRVSEEVTERYATGRTRRLRFGQLVLRMFAPLL